MIELPKNPWGYKEARDFPNSNVGQKRLVYDDCQKDMLEWFVKELEAERIANTSHHIQELKALLEAMRKEEGNDYSF
jgi:hypothetical protein